MQGEERGETAFEILRTAGRGGLRTANATKDAATEADGQRTRHMEAHVIPDGRIRSAVPECANDGHGLNVWLWQDYDHGPIYQYCLHDKRIPP